VPVGSDLSVVQAAYENLIRRCDPNRFESGSEEQQTAAQILVKINSSYDTLRKRLDPTQNRFDKLELE
jgi:DnaJ-domain-containing protein 1